MKRVLPFSLALAGAFAAVDGTVYNRTLCKPQPGAVVALYKLGPDGMEWVERAKSDAKGKFLIAQIPQGPSLLQTAYDGVTYNHMLPPGSPTNNLELEVFNSSRLPGGAQVVQHMVLFEPTGKELSVSESFIFRNDGKITYNDPQRGTLRFFLPEKAQGSVQVNAQAPQGMPIRRAADKTEQPNVYQVDFPIKPGETRIDLTYLMVFANPGVFESRLLYRGGPTRLVAPAGVTIQGEGIESLGQEPRTRASIYGVKGREYTVQILGTGSLRGPDGTSEEEAGPSIEQILPKMYDRRYLVLGLALLILGLGFLMLYRRAAPVRPDASEPARGSRRG